MNLKRFLSAILVALMVLTVLPAASLAETVNAGITEAHKLQLLDDAWAEIETVEDEALSKKATPAEVTMAAYKAALNSGYVDEGSMVWESDKQFAFTVDGMHCLYYYTARAAQKNVKEGDGETIVTSFASKSGNCAGSPNVLLVGPYYSSDSSFTDQYKNEADSIGEATGGTVTKLVNANATGPAIAAAYTDKGVVIYDSHGTQSGTSSYLCLTTNSGITTTDYNNGWAVSSGSAAYIDGRYIQNHVSGTLSNPLVWMAICEGMKKAGNGTTGTALIAAGAAAVYGYSQSVTFKGDYEYEAVFWNQMKDGANMADALVTMKNQYGVPDPYGDAYPIVMSPVDSFPSNPDAAQTVNCDWTLFSQDPIALESFNITDNAGNVLANSSVAQGKKLNVKIAATPNNANTYTVAWSSSNNSIATVTPSTNGKTAVITGITPGNATITATVTDNTKAVFTKTVAVTVTEAPQWGPVDTIVPGEEYLIGFVANGTTYLAVNYNASASNHYYFTSSNYDYYGYTAPATFNGQNIIGVSGNADDLEYCTWIFSSANGGTIQSGYQSSYYLRTWTSTSYSDCYVDTTSQEWTYSNHSLYRTISNTNRYAQYISNSGTNGMCVGSSVPSGYSVQLYAQTTVVEPTTYYTVTFVDWDGTVLSTQQVPEGGSATAPAAPSRPGYTFTGWDVAFTNVTSNLTVTATYTQNDPTTEVTYERVYAIEDGEEYIIVANGSVSGTSGVAMGNTSVSNNRYLLGVAVTINDTDNTVSAGESTIPSILWKAAAMGNDGYSFYNAAVGQYMSLDSGYYLYPGATAVAWYFTDAQRLDNKVDPDLYYFLSYNNGSDSVGIARYTTSKDSTTSDLVIRLYKKVVPVAPVTYYTVTFVDWDGTVLSTQQVEEGQSAVAPADPSREGYTFTGWDVDFSNVTGDLTVTATYELIPVVVGPAVTYTGETVEVTNPVVGDTFYWTLNVSEASGMFSGHWLVDYNEQYFTASNYSVTWSGGIQSQVQASWDDEEATSDKPAFVCNPNYEGQTGGSPQGEAGNMYSNVGMYLTSSEYMGLQMGGSMVRLTMQWTTVPTESMTIPVPVIVLESTYMTMNNGTPGYTPHTDVTVNNGAVIVTIAGEPHSVTYTGATVEQVDPANGDTFFWTLDVSEASGMFSGHWLVDYAEEYFTVSNYSVTWSGGIQTQVQNSWDDEEAWSDKPAFVCNANYEGQTGGAPAGEAGNMYSNIGMYLTSNQFMGLQMGGSMVRLTMQWTNVPTESMEIPVPVEVLESTYLAALPSTYAPHEEVNVINGKVIVTISAAEAPAVTYTGATVEQVDPANGDTFFWTLDVSEASGMFSGHWLVDYAEEYFTVSNYSVTWSGGIQTQVQNSWDDEEAWSDKPAFVCNPNYEGQSGGSPAGEAGNMYSNIGMYLTSNQFMGLQMGGSMVRLTMQWTNVPTESMEIPVPVTVLESTYLAAAPSTYLPHEDVTVIDGKVIVTISEVAEYTLTINYVDANGNEMAPTYTATMEEGTDYNVASPAITGYVASPAVVTGTLTEDTTVTVTYIPVSYQLRIYYLNVATDMALETAYIANVAYGTEYSVTSPEIPGYHLVDPTQAVVSGTMPAYNVEIDVYYEANVHTVTYMVDGNVFMTQEYAYGAAVTAPAAPAVEGYTFVGWDNLPATMPDADVVVNAVYEANEYTVTVHYVYEDGTPAAEDVVITVAYGEAYNVVSPEIEGYEYDIDAVVGTMGAADVEVTVTYTEIPVGTFVWGDADCDGLCTWADVSALYLFLTGEGTLSAQGQINADVANSNPFVDPADMTGIDGVCSWNDVTYISLYLLGELVDPSTVVTEEYTLTINYVDANGNELAPAYTATLAEGSEYSVTSPAVTGYTAETAVVSGTITEDTVITVVYAANEYTITYYVDGEVYATQTYAYGEAVVAPEYTAPEGYNFSGWQGVPATMPAQNVNVYGTTSAKTYRLAIYYLKDTTGGALANAYITNVAYGASYSVTSPTVSGWHLVDEAQAVISGVMPAQNVEIDVYYTQNTYTITYMVNGEVFYTEENVEGAVIVAPEAPAIEGYTFAGWANLPATMPAQDVTVEAVYNLNSYTLTINYVDGNGNVVAPAYTAELAYGEAYEVASPEVEGYTTETTTVSGVMPAEDVTIDVVYTAAAVPQGPAVTYYIEDIEAGSPSAGANIPFMYFCVSEGSCMFSGHWLLDYDERFMEASAYSVTWSGSITTQIGNTWDDEEAWSDKPAFVCNMAYEGATGGSPAGEAGNMYANCGMYLTSNQYGGVQMGGPAIRIRFKWTAVPTAADCLQDANGYYLPIYIIVLESTYLESAPSNYLPHDDITIQDGHIYVEL